MSADAATCVQILAESPGQYARGRRERGDLRDGSALDARDGKDYISRLRAPSGWDRRSALVGAPKSLTGREIEASPPWRAISIFGVALMNRSNRIDHIRLTSHPDPNAKVRFPIHWGASSAYERGPIIGTVSRPQDRNVIGSHGGSYALYRALAVSSGTLDPIRRSDLTNTYPAAKIGPFSAMDGATPHCVHGSLGTSGRGDLPIGDSRWSRPSSEHCSHPRSP